MVAWMPRDHDQEASRLRSLISAAAGRPPRSRYAPGLRAAVSAFLQRSGRSQASVAAELGVNSRTLSRWARLVPAAAPVLQPVFRRVEVVGTPAAPASLVVHGPGGLRVEGVELATLLSLWRALL